MRPELHLHSEISDLSYPTVKRALVKAAISTKRSTVEEDYMVTHLHYWLQEFISTGDYDHRNFDCPSPARGKNTKGGEDDDCHTCDTINRYLNSFELASCSDPVAHLETLMQEINRRARLTLAPEAAKLVFSYLANVCEKINKLAIESELLKMKMNGDILYDSNEMESLIYSDEEFESSPLDTLNPLIEGETDQEIEETSNKQEVPYQNYTTDEWENVTPVKQPRAYEMTKMDTDTLLDLYNYYTQLNSFFKDGSFDKKIGIIKAVLSDRTNKVVKF